MFSRKYKLLLSLLGLIVFGIILLVTSYYGAGLTPDSGAYIAAARSMAEGKGFFTGYGAFVWWPPLYPALLGTIGFVSGVDPLSSAPVINAILFGLIVYLSGVLFHKKLTSSISFVFICTIFIMVSNQLFQVSVMVWAEPLFICFVLLYLIYLDSYLIKTDTKSLLLLSFAAALACLTRYIGVILIVTGVINILVFRRDYFKAKILHLILFVFISSLPISIWIIRNYFLTGTLTGYRKPFSYTLGEGLNYIFNLFLSWYVPGKIVEHRLILILLGAVIFFLFGITFKNIWMKEKAILLNISPILLFIIFYWITLIIFQYDTLDNRLSSPVFVPVTLLLFFFIEQLFKLLSYRFKPNLIKISSILVIILLSLVPAKATISLAANYMENGGWGYNNKRWKNSETINYLLKHSSIEFEHPIYTNDPDAIFILTNRIFQWAPRRKEWKTNEIFNLVHLWPKEDMAFLVWFNSIKRKSLFTIDELKRVVNMERITQLNDGTIYLITKKRLQFHY